MRLQLIGALLVGGLGSVLFAGVAHADGAIYVRGAAYRERSTVVNQPMVDAELEVGTKGSLDAHILVDSITSASPATGQAVEWTETRTELGLGYLHDFTSLRAGLSLRYSAESDYLSQYVGLRFEKDFFQKNTVVGLVLGRAWDDIDNAVSVENGEIGTPRREEQLTTGLASVSLTQVLSTTLLGTLTYDFIDSHGYHANIYRVVFGGAAPEPERVPDDRYRHAVFGGLRGFIEPTGSVLELGYRFYYDSWEIMGHTPEVRLVQEVVDGLELRARYRMHTQSDSYFYKDIYDRADIEDTMQYVTEDEKLGALTTHLTGLKAVVALDLFGVTGSWSDLRVDVGLERLWQSTSFGDAWIGQVGVEIPVEY